MKKLLVFVFPALFVFSPSSPNYALAQTCNPSFCRSNAECTSQCTGGTFRCRILQYGIGTCELVPTTPGSSGSATGNTGTGRSPYCDPPTNTQINTAIGCIPVNDTNAFAGWFLGWAIGVSGGLALLLIVFSGFQIMTASGDPQKLQSGRELLTSAISGLILIIFSIFLLRLIGVQILNIPGLS